MTTSLLPSLPRPTPGRFLRSAAPLLGLALLAVGALPSASAETGSAPASQQRRVISGVHTDAISVSVDGGGLVLGSKADVDGSLGVALDPDLTLFNVEEAARTTVPNSESFAFLGAVGADVWIAPENQEDGVIWPGFSSEDVPVGVLEGNQLTLRLDSVTGPGTLHVWQSGNFGEPIRLFSSTGTDYHEWTIPRGTHAHANWAFSAPGAYTLTFRASALIDGAPVTSTQAYAFVVGDVPPAVSTSTTLAASTATTLLGAAVDLTATVTPSDAVGYVEFLDGTTLLGHEAVNAGSATLSTTDLGLGMRSVTARFVPQWLNDFTATTSAPVEITVTDSSGLPFSITGIAASYQAGDTLNAEVVGVTLGTGQTLRWYMRPIGVTEYYGSNLQTSTSETFSRQLSVADIGYEMAVVLRQGTTLTAWTPWVPIVVQPTGVEPLTLTRTSDEFVYTGDYWTATIGGRALAAGETRRIVFRSSGSAWAASTGAVITGDDVSEPTSGTKNYEWAVQVLSDGVAVAQSEPIWMRTGQREISLLGVRPVYRDGQTLEVSATIYPPKEGLSYTWLFFPASGGSETLKEQPAGTPMSEVNVSRVLTAADHEGRILLTARYLYPGASSATTVDTEAVLIYVSSAGAEEQLFFFENLAGHYHQGENINFNLVADPLLTEDDTIAWEWKWPGTDWTTLPDASGQTHAIIAEQALDEVEVRATLTYGDTSETMLAGPVTIEVDDHGAAARQQPTIAGVTSYTAGDQVTLTRELPDNGATILTTHLWERKGAGETEFSPVNGQMEATLSFAAAPADDGAAYRVSILKPDGTVAYGPSPAVSLAVEFIATDGLAPFALPVTYGVSGENSSTALYGGDFNGDGIVDLVNVGGYPASVDLLLGNGDGTFQEYQTINAGSPQYNRSATAGDFDGDGDLDLVVGETDLDTIFGQGNNSQVVLYVNDGDGNFTSVEIESGLGTATYVTTIDLNGDGRDDYLRANSTNVWYYQALPEGGFAEPETIFESESAFVITTSLQSSDIDDDGDADVIFHDYYSGLTILENDGAGNLAEPQTPLVFGNSDRFRNLVDVNGDGLIDVLASDSSGLVYYVQNADGSFGPSTSTGLSGTSAWAADLNSDDVADLIFLQGSNLAWAAGRDGATFATSQLLGVVNPKAVVAHDFDGDGDTDIVASTGTAVVPVTYLENQTGESPMQLIPPPSRTYLGGEQITLQVHFGFPIYVTGTPRIALDLDGTTIYADYLSGSGSPTLMFSYTVGATDVGLDGLQLVNNVIDLHGGTLTDPALGDAVLAFPGTLSGVIVNATGPLVQMISRLDTQATDAETVRFNLQFAEDVTGVDTSDFAARMVEGDLTGAAVTGVTGSGSQYEVTVSTGTGGGALGLTVLGTASIADLDGHAFSKEYAGGEVYTVRKAPISALATYYTHGHADFRPLFGNGEFSFILNPDDYLLPEPTYQSEQIITYLDSTALANRAAESDFDFLGVGADEPLYVATSSGSVSTAPYLGWSGESLASNVFAERTTSSTSTTLREYLKIQMVGFRTGSGGDFSIYSVSSSSGNVTVRMATSDGIDENDRIWTYAGSHSHYNTAFSKPGTYEVDVVICGYLDDNANNALDPNIDTYVESGIKTLVFHVDTLGAFDDSYSLLAGETLNGDVSLNDDWHEAMGDYTASIESEPTNGTLTLTADGSFTYTPNGGFFGTDSFVYRLTNERGGFTTAAVALTVVHPLDVWRQLYFGTTANAGDAADGFDADSDGLSNLLEFAFGLDPTRPDAQKLILTGSTLTLRGQPEAWQQTTESGVEFHALFCRRKDHQSAGLTYTVQFSADLVVWADATEAPVVVASDAEVEVVAVRYSLPLGPETTTLFFRVIVATP